MKFLYILLTSVFLGTASPAHSDTTMFPSISVEVAIERARSYIKKKNIDLSRKSIVRVEYHSGIKNEYKKPYWLIYWAENNVSKNIVIMGGGFEVRLYEDGAIEQTGYK